MESSMLMQIIGTSLPQYCAGLLETGYSRIPRRDAVDQKHLPYQGSVEEHARLLGFSREVMEKLIKDARIQNASLPTLVHADLHKRNIYVLPEDPTVITGIIDWQSTSLEPAFVYADETPNLASLPEENISDEDDTSVAATEHKKMVKDASICYQIYNVSLKGLVPKLRAARVLDPTLFRIFHYCHTSWRDSATALRQELIELSSRWNELGMEGSCPYLPTKEELDEYAQHYEDFETVQRLKQWLRQSLNTNSDGWVPNEAWGAAKDAHRAAYDEWIETARESEAQGGDLTVEKADKLWPFDSR
jgi:hypothetical protein